MSDSVYMVVTVLGEGGQGSRGGSIAIFARTPHSRGRQAGHGDHGWQGGGLQDEGSSILQI